MNKVSIIVPNYNHAAFLVQRMESILKQTFQDFEIIILDDCSTDDSIQIIEKYRSNEKVKSIIVNEKNSGSTFAQWQRGIQNSTGKYIWIAESDDFCDPEFLEKGVEKLESGFDLFNAMTVNTDEYGIQKSETKTWHDDLSPTRWKSDFENNAVDEVTEMLFVKNTIANASAVLFKRTEKINTYLEKIKDMRYCGDWIFWMMYLLDAKKIYYSASVKSYFRTHPAVTRRSYSEEKRNNEVLRVLRFVLKNPLSKGKRKFLINYYFRNHFFKKGKRQLFSNFNLFAKQFFVSPRFFSSWVTYYLN